MASNGMLLKASNFKDRSELAALCRPFKFKHLGDESAEKAQLQKELGWKHVQEVGKFYDHKGSTDWYFYVYGTTAYGDVKTLPLNYAATKACGRKITGDVVLVKSGPEDSTFSPNLTVDEVVESIMYYMGSNVAKSVFRNREMARASKKYGFDTNKTMAMSMQF